MTHPDEQTNPGDNSGDGIRATYAGAKRRIASLEEELKTLRESGKKRKSEETSHITQGRAICRLVSLFEFVERLVAEGDRRRRVEEEEDENDAEPPTLDQERTFRGYQLLVKHVKGFEDQLLNLDHSQLYLYFRELRKGEAGARGDDAANLKPAVVSWVGSILEHTSHVPLTPTIKTDRGFGHELTGRLLCPVDYNWNDPEVQQNICDGHPNFVVTGDLWPSFLYPHAKFNVNDVEEGLFKSAILLKTFKFLMTSPTSAQNIDTKKDLDEPAFRPSKKRRYNRAPTRGHVANLIGMTSVTPRSIAYVAVQLRFALSNASAWHEEDGCFSYVLFYNNIVDFFELTPGPASQRRSIELLNWWSSKVFGRHTLAPAVRSTPNASVTKLASQRAAKELEAANALLGMGRGNRILE